jgi:hypothetical protein
MRGTSHGHGDGAARSVLHAGLRRMHGVDPGGVAVGGEAWSRSPTVYGEVRRSSERSLAVSHQIANPSSPLSSTTSSGIPKIRISEFWKHPPPMMPQLENRVIRKTGTASRAPEASAPSAVRPGLLGRERHATIPTQIAPAAPKIPARLAGGNSIRCNEKSPPPTPSAMRSAPHMRLAHVRRVRRIGCPSAKFLSPLTLVHWRLKQATSIAAGFGDRLIANRSIAVDSATDSTRPTNF